MEPKYKRILTCYQVRPFAGERGVGIDIKNSSKQWHKKFEEVHNLELKLLSLSEVVTSGVENLLRKLDGSYKQTIQECLEQSYERFSDGRFIATSWSGIHVFRLQSQCNKWLSLISEDALRHLGKGRIVIFGAGVGSPYSQLIQLQPLRAAEIEADAILMAKNGVDGVYNADPKKDKTAVKFEELTHRDVINKGLRIMDSTASTLSMDNDIDLVVFNMNQPGNIKRVVFGEKHRNYSF